MSSSLLLLLGLFACISYAIGHDETMNWDESEPGSDDSFSDEDVDLSERQLLPVRRVVTASRTIIPNYGLGGYGYGGLYGGLGGFGYGGLGYGGLGYGGLGYGGLGYGGLGYGGLFDEESVSDSDTKDSKGSQNDHGYGYRVIRVPHRVISKLMRGDLGEDNSEFGSESNIDNIDLSETQPVDGIDGSEMVLRVPHRVFRHLSRKYSRGSYRRHHKEHLGGDSSNFGISSMTTGQQKVLRLPHRTIQKLLRHFSHNRRREMVDNTGSIDNSASVDNTAPVDQTSATKVLRVPHRIWNKLRQQENLRVLLVSNSGDI